jgi:hypothetical protein
VASAREFGRTSRLTSIPHTSTGSNSSASILHDIDVDWNDISIILSGLDSVASVPSFPLKLSSNNQNLARVTTSSIAINLDSSNKHFKSKPSTSALSGKSGNANVNAKPMQGAHCEQFLKKIGLMKNDDSDSDHMCNHFNGQVIKNFYHHNKFICHLLILYYLLQCRRWQFNLKKLLQVLSKGEDACIEIFIGPENNAILLEQWILTITNK